MADAMAEFSDKIKYFLVIRVADVRMSGIYGQLEIRKLF